MVNIVGFTNELDRNIKAVQEYFASMPPTVSPKTDEDLRTIVKEEMPEAISFINSSTQKMDGLIASILLMSREGKKNLQSTQIDLRELVEASAAAIQHQLSVNDGQINLDLRVREITTDRLALEQIVGNLLDNAVKYRSKVRPLRILMKSERIRDQIILQVTDNGRGISESDLGKIFELFKRVGPRDQAGEGVGLAYVQMMVRKLGGDISVDSTLDIGTTFSVSLPLELKPQP